ncbi:hypothetical protein V1511DRAFT_484203 [Dipodascopsis uninucleata]
MDQSKLQIQTRTVPGQSQPITEYIYPCSGCKSRIVKQNLADLLAVFTSSTDGQFMRSCQKCRAKGIQNRKKRKDGDSLDLDEEVDLVGPAGSGGNSVLSQGRLDMETQCASFEDFVETIRQFMSIHDSHPEFDPKSQAVRFRVTLLQSGVIPRSSACPISRTVDAVARDTAESQKLAALQIRDALFDSTGYFFQLRKGGKPNPDGGKYNFSCSRAEERRGAYDKTKRMREGSAIRQRRTKVREFYRCEGRVMVSFSRTNAWITIAYAHKRHGETPKIHDKKMSDQLDSDLNPAPDNTTASVLQLAAASAQHMDPALQQLQAEQQHSSHYHHQASQDQLQEHGAILLHTVG